MKSLTCTYRSYGSHGSYGFLRSLLFFHCLCLALLSLPLSAEAAPDDFRDTLILNGQWYVLGRGAELGPVPASWFQGLPSQAATVNWPGPMDVSAAAGDASTSVTMVFWKVIEAPRRWLGRGVWVEFPKLTGPTRLYLNGAPVGGRDMAGGASASVGLTPHLSPGDSSLLVVEVRGGIAAVDMLRGDPPLVRAGAPLHIAHLRARPAEEGGVLWIDAGLRDLPGAGATRAAVGAETDEFSVDFEIREGPADKAGAVIPGGTLRSFRVNPRQMNITAPVPVTDYRSWTPDGPALYTVTATLLRNAKPVDRVTLTTGFARWAIRDSRLYLNGQPIPLFCATLAPGLAGLAEEGGWAEIAAAGSGLAAQSPSAFLDLVNKRRRSYWTDALIRLRGMGFTMVRCSDGPAPVAMLEAADRVGMLVEQRLVTRPWTVDGERGGGIASAYVVAAAAQRDQFHPSLAFWRIECLGGAIQLDALARAMTLLDAVRPVFAFLQGDNRVRRPGLLRRPGAANSEAVVETLRLPETTSLLRTWELYSRLTKPGERLPVSVGWTWTPDVLEVTPDTLSLAVERLLLARANPGSGGTGVEFGLPPWARAGKPITRKVPPVEELFWALRDPATSPTLAAVFRRSYVMLSPETHELKRGGKTKVEIAVLLAPAEPHPGMATLRLTLRPPADRPGAFSPSVSDHGIDLARFAGDADAVRAGIELNLNAELPDGAAVLEAEIQWAGTTLRSGAHDTVIQP